MTDEAKNIEEYLEELLKDQAYMSLPNSRPPGNYYHYAITFSGVDEDDVDMKILVYVYNRMRKAKGLEPVENITRKKIWKFWG